MPVVFPLSHRAPSSFQAVIISIGGLIGAGLFVGIGTPMAFVGPTIVVTYGMAGLVLLAIVDLMAQMRRTRPNVLFITDFVHLGLGSGFGLVSAWVYGCFWTLVVTIEALAGANIIVPSGGLWGLLAGAGLLVVSVALSHSLSAALSEIEVGFAVLKLGVIATFIALALPLLAGRNYAGVSPAPWIRGALAPHEAVTVLAGLGMALVSLAGVEIINTIADSTRLSGKPCPPATVLISARVFGIYLISIIVVLLFVRPKNIRPGFSPFTLALEALGHARAARWLGAVILVAVVSTLNSALVICSAVFGRVMSAEKGPGTVELDGTARPSLRGQLLTSTLALILVGLAALWPTEAYAALVKAAGGLIVIVYILFIVAADRLASPVKESLDRRCAGTRGRWVRYALVASLAGALLSMAWVRGLAHALVGALSLVLFVTLLETRRRRHVKPQDARHEMRTTG